MSKTTDDKALADTRAEANDLTLFGDGAGINSIADLFNEGADAGLVMEEFTSGWGDVLNGADKDRLVGVELAVRQWKFHTGKMGAFVSAEIMTRDGQKYVVNDGGAGIFRQLEEITVFRIENGIPNAQVGPLHVKRGLRRSDYEFTDANGEMKPASTYYLA